MRAKGYYRKKARLAAIQHEWSDRLRAAREGRPSPSRLGYGELVDEYRAARYKSRRHRGWEY